MKLWYVSLWLNPETGFSDEYRYQFKLDTRFISNFFSREVRKMRFETDGTFNLLAIEPCIEKAETVKIVSDAALRISFPFDRRRYEVSRGTEDYSYYLEILRRGFELASQHKKIPLEELNLVVDEFEKNDCKNEWLHKKRLFREYDLRVTARCFFTASDFRLEVTIDRISTGKELCSGTVIRTEPDEILFKGTFREISIEDRGIIISSDFGYSAVIDIEKAMLGEFVFHNDGNEEYVRSLGLDGLVQPE